MTWNYRMLEHKNVDGTSWFAIHEVYYDEASIPKYCSDEPCSAFLVLLWTMATFHCGCKQDDHHQTTSLSHAHALAGYRMG